MCSRTQTEVLVQGEHQQLIVASVACVPTLRPICRVVFRSYGDMDGGAFHNSTSFESRAPLLTIHSFGDWVV